VPIGCPAWATCFALSVLWPSVRGRARIRRHRIVARDLHALRARLARRIADGGACRIVCRREPTLLVVVRVVLPQSHPRHVSAQPQFGARLLARFDAGRDEDLQRLSLLKRVDRVVADMRRIRATARPIETWMIWSSALLTQFLSGTAPPASPQSRIVSLVARFTWLTKGETDTAKA